MLTHTHERVKDGLQGACSHSGADGTGYMRVREEGRVSVLEARACDCTRVPPCALVCKRDMSVPNALWAGERKFDGARC